MLKTVLIVVVVFNAHIRLPDGKSIPVEAQRDVLRADRLTQRGANACQHVPDAGAWVDSLRGNDACSPSWLTPAF